MLSLLSLLKGEIFVAENDWTNAEKSFTQSLDLVSRSGQEYYLANWHIKIASIYNESSKRKEAYDHLSAALVICEKNSLPGLADFVRKRIMELGFAK